MTYSQTLKRSAELAGDLHDADGTTFNGQFGALIIAAAVILGCARVADAIDDLRRTK